MGYTVLHMDITTESRTHTLAEVVRDALHDAGIPQREASQRSGIPINTLSRRLTGKSPLTISELAELADIAGRSLTSLIAEVEQRLESDAA